MLISYGLKNFFGFKEGAEVSFKIPKKADNNNDGIARLMCVKGKNASGKTNLLKALAFLSDFCSKSFQQYDPKDYINIEPFFRNQEPSEFYVDFISNGCTYRYELVLTDEEVIKETLYRKNSRKVKIIERNKNTFSHLISDLSELSTMKLRSNVSFVSSYKQYDLHPISALEDVYNFFSHVMYNVSYTGLINQTVDTNSISELLYNSSTMFDFIKRIIISCDTGIKDIIIKKDKDDETGRYKYTPFFVHEVDGKEYLLHMFAESSGTKSLYTQLGAYQVVLALGGILCLDEFDINLHPHILPKLLGLFECPEQNNNGAQLLFTSHNSDIMEYMGKYRTYLVEKINNECFSYRLDEIPSDIIRNDRAILPLYNSGKLGGVPNL